MSGTIGDARKALAEKVAHNAAPIPVVAQRHLLLAGDTFTRCCGRRAGALRIEGQLITADPWATTCGEEAEPLAEWEVKVLEEEAFIDSLSATHVEVDPTSRDRVEESLRTTFEYVDSADFIFDRFKPVRHDDEPEVPSPDFSVPRCVICKRERTAGGPGHPMDAYDYSAVQVITGQPVGWYSGDDGEICPEDMANMLGGRA